MSNEELGGVERFKNCWLIQWLEANPVLNIVKHIVDNDDMLFWFGQNLVHLTFHFFLLCGYGLTVSENEKKIKKQV